MIIDLTSIVTNSVDSIDVDINVNIDRELYKDTEIRNLIDVKFVGKIVKVCDDTYNISGKLTGIMILPDDITLEDVNYSFDTDIDEDIEENCEIDENSLKIIQNRLDITDFLWQNILVEIPSKVKNPKNDNLTLEGNGWRLVTEDEINIGSNSPLSELSKIFDSRKE